MLKLFLILTLLIAAPTVGAAISADELNNKLKLADELRTSSPKDFLNVLSELENNRSQFTQYQEEFFNYLKAYQLSISGKFKEALVIYNEIYDRDLEKEVSLRALASIVNSYAILGDHYKGTVYLLELLKRAESVDNKDLKELGYVIAAVFYNQMSKYELGKGFANSVLQSSPPPRYECVARNTLIESHFNEEDYHQDIAFIDESINFCKSNNDFIMAGIITVYKAKELLKQENVNDALKELLDNEDWIMETGYPPLSSVLHSTLGEAYFKLKNYELAKEYSQATIDLFSGVGNIFTLVVASKTLFEIAAIEGKVEEELKNYKLYVEYEKKYTDDLTTKELILRLAETEDLEKQNHLLLLDKENALLKTQAELARKEAQNNQLLLALACSAVLILFVWLYRNRRAQVRLRKMAETDALTGINNRNHFTTCAEQQLRYTKNRKTPISFILFDLDLFKKINDTYGHQTGDWALKNAVKAASTVCRSNDIIGRMGGEEFALLLPNCSADKAVKIAEMCRKAIENIDTKDTGFDFTITASFGVSDSNLCEHNFDKLYGCADAALYQSKSHGRNQVYQFEENTPAVFG